MIIVECYAEDELARALGDMSSYLRRIVTATEDLLMLVEQKKG